MCYPNDYLHGPNMKALLDFKIWKHTTYLSKQKFLNVYTASAYFSHVTIVSHVMHLCFSGDVFPASMVNGGAQVHFLLQLHMREP